MCPGFQDKSGVLDYKPDDSSDGIVLPHGDIKGKSISDPAFVADQTQSILKMSCVSHSNHLAVVGKGVVC